MYVQENFIEEDTSQNVFKTVKVKRKNLDNNEVFTQISSEEVANTENDIEVSLSESSNNTHNSEFEKKI